MLITQVTPGSPAQVAGLEVRDVVLTVDGFQVGIVKGRRYDLQREVVERWRTESVVTLLVQDWRTENLTNLRVDSRAGGSTRPPIDRPGSSDSAQIRYWYQEYLERQPTRSELASWIDSLGRGPMQLADIKAYLLGGREFYERFGRNNDLAFLNALFLKTQNRRPSVAELGQWIIELRRFPGARVAFVQEYLQSIGSGSGSGNGFMPGATAAQQVSDALRSYQRGMTQFATWGYYSEQSSLIYNSIELVRQIEQYSLGGYNATYQQQELARQLIGNADRLTALAGQLLERAKRVNSRVSDVRDLVRIGGQIRAAALQLTRELGN